jgi:hypothetical protein
VCVCVCVCVCVLPSSACDAFAYLFELLHMPVCSEGSTVRHAQRKWYARIRTHTHAHTHAHAHSAKTSHTHAHTRTRRALLAFRELGMQMSFTSPDAPPHRCVCMCVCVCLCVCVLVCMFVVEQHVAYVTSICLS